MMGLTVWGWGATSKPAEFHWHPRQRQLLFGERPLVREEGRPVETDRELGCLWSWLFPPRKPGNIEEHNGFEHQSASIFD